MNPSASFWVETDRGLEEFSAAEIFDKFREAEIDGETRLRILPDAPPKPLRLYLQELVWDTYRENTGGSLKQTPSEHFRLAFDHAPIGMARSDLAGRITEVNLALVNLLGYSFNELQGMRVGEVSDERDREEELKLAKLLLAGEIEKFQMEKRFRKKDGTVVETMMALSLVRDQMGAPQELLAQVLDLTDYKRKAQADEALESLKTRAALARGISHDYGNILNVILGAVTHLDLLDESRAVKPLEHIEGAVKAAKHLNKQLRALGMSVSPESDETIALDDTIRAGKGMIAALVGPQVALTLDLQAPGIRLGLGIGPFHQIINNLAGNAGQAMADGGSLTVSTYVEVRNSCRWWCLDFADTGHGIDAETKVRVFEPFFTTREESGGSGLGLALVHGITAASGGIIEIKDTSGGGTTFSLRWLCDSEDSSSIVSSLK